MSDFVVFPALALIGTGLVALALVWPQGHGAPSPAPFGHPLPAIENAVVAAKPSLGLRGPDAEPPPASRPIVAKPAANAF